MSSSVSVSHVLEFTVPGRPVPKMRPRVYAVNGKARGVTPEKTREYERGVWWHAISTKVANSETWPMDGRYAVHVDAHIAPTKRPKAPRKMDLDNILKSVLDGLNGVLWDDDSQVDAVSARRWNDSNECVRVRVTCVEE